MWPQSGHTPVPSSFTNSEKQEEASPLVSECKADENLLTIEMDKFLECQVCWDFASSPIHACPNAHVLCGQCAPKLAACPTCKAPKLAPSPVSEKLAKEANKKIACPNFEAGCSKGVLSTKFADHLPLCYFREIRCGYDVNCVSKLKFTEYTKHLEDAHNRAIAIGPKFVSIYSYSKPLNYCPGNGQGQGWLPWVVWGHNVIGFRSRQFVVHSQVSEQMQLFISWVSILGDKDAANNYSCEIELSGPSQKSSGVGCIWKLPVLAFHELPSNETEAKLFERSAVAAIPMVVIKNWGQMNKDLLEFQVSHEIKEA